MLSVSSLLIALIAQPFTSVHAVRHDPQGWKLDVRHDGFIDRTFCRLGSSDGLIRYQPGALGFRFRHRRDTLNAWYRVDNGPPVRWQDRYATLVAAGVHVDGPRLDDPTAGTVWILQAELASTRTVWIQLAAKDRPRRFLLPPIASSLAGAAQQGCNFVEDGGR